jgi:DNA polymerase V
MPRGGKRTGAGRPLGSGRFGEPSIVIRIPASRVSDVRNLVQKTYKLPLYQSAVAAGFPSPADSDMEGMLDLNELLVRHPAATFFVRVSGLSMINAGIHHNDILVVDRSLEPSAGKIVVASINGDLTVKRLIKEEETIRLIAENDGYPPITVSEESDLRIWGVVTNVVHAV